MIRTCVIKKNGKAIKEVPLHAVNDEDVAWYWVDFTSPTTQEIKELSRFFQFHPLAIEDCIEDFSPRPKIDFYDQYNFLLLHGVNQSTLGAFEVNIFVNERFIVTFHKKPVNEVSNLWNQLEHEVYKYSPYNIMHSIIDKLVDDYFSPVYKIEDRLNAIEDHTDENASYDLMDDLFDVRHEMSKLRRSLIPMRDLVYRILNSERLRFLKDEELYFNDVYDHLIKLVEMVESYREFSSDIRDNYLSINSDKMNNIMMTLTVMTTIFMPLTFIVGVYGMNFVYMPELNTRYGYFFVWGLMIGIAILMFSLFMKVGWLRFGRSRKQKRRSIKL
ncbi:magnesium/cobalt transporter CorA [Bacillus sp. 2205SS5-2]|uniref:magnesium/cobalt transporter CorA n=1 Tax=Bacillus sp. 2205SS5-2 TaxID=3109031 RepID=UPI003006062B